MVAVCLVKMDGNTYVFLKIAYFTYLGEDSYCGHGARSSESRDLRTRQDHLQEQSPMYT